MFPVFLNEVCSKIFFQQFLKLHILELSFQIFCFSIHFIDNIRQITSFAFTCHFHGLADSTKATSTFPSLTIVSWASVPVVRFAQWPSRLVGVTTVGVPFNANLGSHPITFLHAKSKRATSSDVVTARKLSQTIAKTCQNSCPP